MPPLLFGQSPGPPPLSFGRGLGIGEAGLFGGLPCPANRILVALLGQQATGLLKGQLSTANIGLNPFGIPRRRPPKETLRVGEISSCLSGKPVVFSGKLLAANRCGFSRADCLLHHPWVGVRVVRQPAGSIQELLGLSAPLVAAWPVGSLAGKGRCQGIDPASHLLPQRGNRSSQIVKLAAATDDRLQAGGCPVKLPLGFLERRYSTKVALPGAIRISPTILLEGLCSLSSLGGAG